MRKSNYRYVAGDWNAICDVCGWKYKASELLAGVGRQKGLRVCKKDFDGDHPQDHFKVRNDNPSVPWTRPEPTDVFTTVTCIADQQQAVVGIGVVGCVVVGRDLSLADDYAVPAGTFTTNNSTL